MQFPLRKEDGPLIEAAIRFADWLLVQPETAPEQCVAIRWLREALRRLPEPTFGYSADFGFRVTDERIYRATDPKELPDSGIQRFWCIAMYPADWTPLFLEIGSGVCDLPRASDFQDEAAQELFFDLNLDGPPYEGTYNFDRWIAEVDSLDRFRQPGSIFEIDATLEPRPAVEVPSGPEAN
jgi:hypothetical protein